MAIIRPEQQRQKSELSRTLLFSILWDSPEKPNLSKLGTVLIKSKKYSFNNPQKNSLVYELLTTVR